MYLSDPINPCLLEHFLLQPIDSSVIYLIHTHKISNQFISYHAQYMILLSTLFIIAVGVYLWPQGYVLGSYTAQIQC